MPGILHDRVFDLPNINRGNDLVRVNPFLTLLIMKFVPNDNNQDPVFFFPGWVTVVEKFIPLIKELNKKKYPVYYIETREKRVSKFNKTPLTYRDFELDNYITDIKAIIDFYKLKNKNFYFLGASFGAGVLIKYLGSNLVNSEYRPKKSILMIPSLNLRFHTWQKILIRIPIVLKPMISVIVEWYLLQQFRNPDEPELAYQFSEKVNDLDAKKIQLSAIAMDRVGGLRFKKEAKTLPRKFGHKILVIGAENDYMHPEKLTRDFANFIKSRYVNLLSNKFTHGDLMGVIAARYFKEGSIKQKLPYNILNLNKEIF